VANTDLIASGMPESASPISILTSGSTFSEPTGITNPSSRSSPRSVLICAVRAASQLERKRCSEHSTCCATVLTGTGRISALRYASRIPFASVRSVLFRVTYGRTWCGGSSTTEWPSSSSFRPQ